MTKVISNFYNDWIEILKTELLNYGYVVDETNPRAIMHQFFNYHKRKIFQQKRTVQKAPSFVCPTELQQGLDLISNKIANGNDLTPHLSKKISDPNYNDGLLNDWGIYHLHLGTTMEGSFVSRTGPVLYARFDENCAYLIAIAKHGSWANKDLLKIVHDNWPESISQYRMNCYGVSSGLSEKEHQESRANGIMIALQFDDVVYYPPGGGIMTSGISRDVVVSADRWTQIVNGFEKDIQNEIDSILQRKNIAIDEIDFKLGTSSSQELVAYNDQFKIQIKGKPI